MSLIITSLNVIFSMLSVYIKCKNNLYDDKTFIKQSGFIKMNEKLIPKNIY